MKKILFTSALALASLAFSAHADEKYAPKSYWLSHGYFPVGHRLAFSHRSETPSWQPHSLAWPVSFQDPQHSLGNSMAEFQSYGDGPYYHGGCDLRVARRAQVRTPVSGRIEAGHYGYTNHPDGSSTKYWTPWPGGGDSVYFEVAVITDDGYRFEFHHMDEDHLPEEILRILKAGGGRVSAGTLLGNVILWPGGGYHHTHYNIITPSGVSLNPEYYSPLIHDTQAPQVSTVLAQMPTGDVVEFGTGSFDPTPSFFALAVIDHQDGNVYDHPPVYAGIHFQSGTEFKWDFRERLLGPEGAFPPIWDFFIRSIRGPHGVRLSTEGGYGQGFSVVRVPVPQGAQGPFVIEVGDEAGNRTSFRGEVRSRLR